MEDAPVPIIVKTPYIYNEFNLLDFTLEFNNNNYIFKLIETNNNKLKILVNNKVNIENELCKFEAFLELDILKTENKYFKMFDNFEEFKKDFIGLCKPTNIKITKVDNKEITIVIELAIKSDNLLNITLNKAEISDKDKISYLILESKNKTIEINNLNLEVNNMKNKISSLEKTVNSLSDKISELQGLKEKMSLLEKKINDNLNKEEDIEFIDKEIYITKRENETKLIEVNDISFKNIGKKVFSGKDNLYFYKGEESSDGIYFNQNIKDRYRQDIILNEDLPSLIERFLSKKIFFL